MRADCRSRSSSIARATCATGSSASVTGARASRCGLSSRSWARAAVPDGKPAAFSIVDRVDGGDRDERAEIIAALQASPASISPKYFYDELGCSLYGAITKLPEYYPTRTEVALFAACRDEIASALGSGRQFVDLGSGDSRKAQ